MNLNKILSFGLILFITISCRDEKTSEIEKLSDPNEKNTELILTPKNNLSNLQVGDRINISFEIKDLDTIGVNYILKPKTDNKVFHQKINEDFYLERKEKRKSDLFGWIYTYITANQISIKPGSLKGNFFIYILQPGNFQHEYILEKYKNGEKVFSTNKNLLFNAVKIYAETYSKQIVKPGTFNHSKHRRFYNFIIDDGNEQFDEYLTTGADKSQTYQVNYAGNWYTEGDGSFSSHISKTFRSFEDREKRAPDVPSDKITEIKIQQKYNDGTINNISYRNIPVIQK